MSQASLQLGIPTRSGDLENVDLADARPRDIEDATTATLHGNGTLDGFPDTDAALAYGESDAPENPELADLIVQLDALAESKDWALSLQSYDDPDRDGQYLSASSRNGGTDPDESRSALAEAGIDI
jgi:hypothetical protein